MIKQTRKGFYYSKGRKCPDCQYFLNHRNGKANVVYFSISPLGDLWICGVWHPIDALDAAIASLGIAVERTIVNQRSVGQAFLDAFRECRIKDVESLKQYLAG